MSGAGHDGEIKDIHYAEAIINIDHSTPQEIFRPVNCEVVRKLPLIV